MLQWMQRLMFAAIVYLSLEHDLCCSVELVVLYSYCTVLFSAASHSMASVCVSVCERSLSEREVLSRQPGRRRRPREVELMSPNIPVCSL